MAQGGKLNPACKCGSALPTALVVYGDRGIVRVDFLCDPCYIGANPRWQAYTRPNNCIVTSVTIGDLAKLIGAKEAT